MKRAMALVALVWSAAALCEGTPEPAEKPAEEKKPLPVLPERYQTIVNRQMFGPLPPDFDPLKPASAATRADARAAEEAAAQLAQEQEKLKSAVRFSMINRKPDGTVMVGFTDSSNPKEARNYYLRLGETRDGWTVKEADPLKASMTIEREGVEVSLTIGGDSSRDDAANRRVGARPGAAPGTETPRNGLAGSAFGGGSLRERRRQRELLRQQAIEEAVKRQQAENDKRQAEREQQQAEREQQQAERDRKNNEEKQLMRAQLSSIAEQLKKAREEREAAKAGEGGEEGSGN